MGHLANGLETRTLSVGVEMRLIRIRASNNEDAACLMRELAVYGPTRSRLSVLIELDERSQTDLLALLTAVETCLSANDMRSVRVELDGRNYMLAPR
jgi:hypothetical protein